MSTPATTAQNNLHTALAAADGYTDDFQIALESAQGQAFADVAGAVKGYCNAVSVLSESRLQGWANELNALMV